MNIVFRVDSSAQVGSGHLMRCLTLADQLHKKYKGAKIYFIARMLGGNLNQLIENNGYEWLKLPSMEADENLTGYEKWLTVQQDVDAQQTAEKLQMLGQVDLLVVDSYALDEKWENVVRAYAKKIMVIDDLANRRHNCDILLDQNYYADMGQRYEGLVPKICEMRIGPSYALLREEFYELKKKLIKRDGSIKNIFIFFGGSDLTNETMKALKAIEMLHWTDLEVNVVVGGSNRHKADIEVYCRNKANIHYFCQVDNIAELMNQADLAIGAGGTTTWERCFLKLPSIVVAIAENQVKIAEDCGKAGLIFYLGTSHEVETADIYNAVINLSKDTLLAYQKNLNWGEMYE